jgi:hypothetical protein
VLRDVCLDHGGAVTELEIERDGLLQTVPSAGAVVVPTRASAA